MKKVFLALGLLLVPAAAIADQVCTDRPVICDDNYLAPAVATIRPKNPAATCAAQYVDVKVNDSTTRITYGTGWCASGGATCVSNKANACASLASQIASVGGIRNANCNAKYEVTVTPAPSGVTYFSLSTSSAACVGVSNPAAGGVVTVGQTKFVENGPGSVSLVALDGTTAASLAVGAVTASTIAGTTATYPTIATTTIDKAAAGTLAIAPTTATAVSIGKPTTATGLFTANDGVKTAKPLFVLDSIRFCGNGSNGATAWYDGPVLISEYYAASQVTGGAACDANDSGTEATADEVVYPYATLKIVGMMCNSEAGGAADTNTFQLRDDTADVAGVTCSVTNDGASPKTCSVVLSAPVTVAAGSALTIKNTQSGTDDMSAKDMECIIYHTF